jgi:hypothetical protein
LVVLCALLLLFLFSLAAGAALLLASAISTYGACVFVVWRSNRFFLSPRWHFSNYVALALVIAASALMGAFAKGFESFLLFSLAAWAVAVAFFLASWAQLTAVRSYSAYVPPPL